MVMNANMVLGALESTLDMTPVGGQWSFSLFTGRDGSLTESTNEYEFSAHMNTRWVSRDDETMAVACGLLPGARCEDVAWRPGTERPRRLRCLHAASAPHARGPRRGSGTHTGRPLEWSTRQLDGPGRAYRNALCRLRSRGTFQSRDARTAQSAASATRGDCAGVA